MNISATKQNIFIKLEQNLSYLYNPIKQGNVCLKERTCEANPAGENSSFIFTVCVKSVPLYHFKLAYVVLHMAVKEFFETHL